MRVLSVPQPFAQLIVRGVKRLEVRSWDPGYSGTIAIHASSTVPSRFDVAGLMQDRETARRFAEQGWLGYDDIRALPYGAIVGTAHLAAVAEGRDVHSGAVHLFAWNDFTERMELAHGVAPRGAGTPRPLGVPLGADDLAWIFLRPVEIEPIPGVAGRQRLTALNAVLTDVVERRVREATSGAWRPPSVDPARVARGLRQWHRDWKAEREAMIAGVVDRVRVDFELSRIWFDARTERLFAADLERYVTMHRVPDTAGAEPVVFVEPRLRALFDGRDRVALPEFTLAIRRKMKREAERQRAEQREERMMERLRTLARELEPKVRGRPTKFQAIQARIAIECERILAENEEDEEFRRRELYVGGDGRAAQGAMRRRRLRGCA